MYMVMPFSREGSFADWLQKQNQRLLSPWDVERIVKQAASALQHAHDRKIIHQDVKPSNFLIQSDAEEANELNLQLADFGVAKFMTTTSESKTIRGTPIYMAPEQWDGRPVPAGLMLLEGSHVVGDRELEHVPLVAVIEEPGEEIPMGIGVQLELHVRDLDLALH